MANKNFKGKTSHLDKFFSGDVSDVPDVHEPPATPEKLYRLSTKISFEYERFIRDEAWKARKTVTQYINDLIKAEMDRVNTSETQVP